jgi:hypothetical protein
MLCSKIEFHPVSAHSGHSYLSGFTDSTLARSRERNGEALKKLQIAAIRETIGSKAVPLLWDIVRKAYDKVTQSQTHPRRGHMIRVIAAEEWFVDEIMWLCLVM